jgi:hypothetical protein
MSGPAPLLIHLHIPRNAGTTLGRMLRFKLGLWPPGRLLRHGRTLGFYRVGGFERRLERIAGLPPEKRRGVRLFEAHAGYGLHRFLPEPSLYLSMLREPVDRVISVYCHLRAEGLVDPAVTIEEFVLHGAADRVWWTDNAQVRYVAGEDGVIVDVPRGRCTRAMLDLARRRVDTAFAFVGITERFAASIVLLRRLLGWHFCHYAPANATRGRPRTQDLPPESLELIREHNALDLELYDHALAAFERRVEAGGEALQRELARFRAVNAWYAPTVGRWPAVLPAVRGMSRRLSAAVPGRPAPPP